MKKRNIDSGLTYVLSLGIKPEKSMSGVVDQLTRATDSVTARNLIQMIDRRADHETDNAQFYSEKNKSFALSFALTGAFDGDIIRKACNWIASHRSVFGKTILEVGCDCGIISCFLGETFPDSHIVAIDRCPEAIQNAKILAEKRSIHNVEFLSCDLKDLDGTYETVFSMRTVHENFTAEEDPLNDLSEQADIFSKELKNYAETLSSKVDQDGSLVSIERIGRNALLLGWIDSLYSSGFTFDLTCYEELKCKEVGKDSVFQAFVSFRKNTEEVTPHQLFDFACSFYIDYSLPQYEGWDAKIVFENKRKTLIEGYDIDYSNINVKRRIALWTHKYDETCLIFYQNDVYYNDHGSNAITLFYDITQKDDVIDQIRTAVDEAKAYNSTTKVTQIKI